MARITLPESGIETLFGSYDENLKHLESQFGVRLRTQGHDVIVDGPPADVGKVERLFSQLGALFQEGYRVSNGDVKTAAQLIASDPNIDLREYFLKSTQTQSGKRRIAPKTVNQRRYLDAIEQNDIVFGIGPAGTGKTYLAMAQAVSFLLAKRVTRIILARPAVEAGEKLGLPAGRSAGKGEPVPAAALRRAVRHGRSRARRAADRARHDRDRADRVHARPHAERRVRHPRRSAEHDVGADEDVPHAPGLRIEGGRDRRHHADRPAERRASRAWSKR